MHSRRQGAVVRSPAMAMTIAQALELAVDHHRAGRFAEAGQIYRGILETAPGHQDALHLLGLIAHQTGDNAGAAELIGRAIGAAPGIAMFHYHLGVVQAALKRTAEAAGSLRTAIEIDPRMPGPRTELALCLLGEGKDREASALLKEAIELDPGDAVAVRNLAVCCANLGLLDDAENHARRAVELDPADAGGWNNLAGILISRGEPAAAAPLYEEAYQRDPAYSMAYSNRLMCEQYLPGVTEERLLQLSVGWQARYGVPPHAFPAGRPPGRGEGGLRVGFVSPDLKRAPVGYFLAGVLDALRGGPVSVVAYSNTAGQDDLTEKIRQATSLWRDMGESSHDQFAQVVREDDIDILFDLAGHTKGNRLPVFARRAAPVQVTWAGYVGTTGLDAMDYILADRFQLPPSSERHYRERVLRMPHDYVCYAPPSYAPDVGPLPALARGHVTFGAFHNAAKTGGPSIAAWSSVMQAVADSRIVLKYRDLDDSRTRQRILDAFAAAGIAGERIVIEGTSPHVDMLRRYNDVDIALDSMPYSGGLTTCEALWMGAPVVTLPGTTFAGRHSLSHLNNAGHPELVAKDIADYVRIASALAGDLPRLAALRKSLRADMANSPLCDAQTFATDFVRVLQSIAPKP